MSEVKGTRILMPDEPGIPPLPEIEFYLKRTEGDPILYLMGRERPFDEDDEGWVVATIESDGLHVWGAINPQGLGNIPLDKDGRIKIIKG